MVRAIPLEIVGRRFRSLTEAARTCGTTVAAISAAVKRHGPVLDYIPRPKDFRSVPGYKAPVGKRGDGVLAEGVLYGSYVECAKCYGVHEQSMRQALWAKANLTERYGPPLTPEQAATMTEHDPVELFGVRYPTVKKAAQAFGKSWSGLLRAVILGQGEDYIKTAPSARDRGGPIKSGRPVTVGGVHYISVRRLSDATGLPYNLLWRIINDGKQDLLESMVSDALESRAEAR